RRRQPTRLHRGPIIAGWRLDALLCRDTARRTELGISVPRDVSLSTWIVTKATPGAGWGEAVVHFDSPPTPVGDRTLRLFGPVCALLLTLPPFSLARRVS